MRKSVIIAVAAAIGFSTPAQAEVTSTGETWFITKDSADIAATPRQVWLALIKPGLWWNDAHTWSGDASNMMLTPQAGACFCEKMPGDADIPLDGSVQHAFVEQAVPDKVLRLRGGFGPLQDNPATGVLTIMLEEIEGGTRVSWQYFVGGPMTFSIKDIAPAVDGVMTQQLHGLRDHLGALEQEMDD